MKMIDILVEELPKRGGWPDDSDEMCQSQFDCEIYTNSRLLPDFYVGERAEDNGIDNGITREQYEAELAAKNDGWIEWGGGECPVPSGTLVDVKWRDGKIDDGIPAKISHDLDPSKRHAISWRHHHGDSYDIIAYRLHQLQEAEQAKSELNDCIEQDAAPVWNGEGLPPVGVECESKQFAQIDWHKFRVVAIENGCVFGFWNDKVGVCLDSKHWEFRQLRTEAERKREDVRKAIYAAMNIIDGDIADAIYDAIAAGKIPGVKLED